MTDPGQYAQVALDVPILGALTYRIPDHLRGVLVPGQLVQAPFRNRSKIGLVIEVTDHVDPELAPKVRDVVDIVDREPLLTPEGLEFLRFLADYYMSPFGDVVRLAIPAAVRLEGLKHYRRLEMSGPGLSLDLLAVLSGMGDEAVPVAALRESSHLTYARLADLETAGVVEVSYAEEVTISIKTDKFYTLVEDGERTGLGSKQAQVVDYIDGEGPEVSLSELRHAFDGVHSSLNRLVERGVLNVEEREVYRDPFANAAVVAPSDAELTEDQQRAIDQIRLFAARQAFRAFLLHGVTGSGKTRVYVEAIRDALAARRTAIVLLPEIALTPQFVSVFRGYFEGSIAVLHSGLSPAEKFDEWRRIRRGEVDIVIGARSAVFAPLSNIGIIIVDEEHDPSFKQEEGPRYNARDMALVRGKLEGALVVLGSATPSLESFQNAREGRFEYLPMPRRVFDRPMPPVELVDLRTRGGDVGERRSEFLTDPLLDALQETLNQEQQAILFLNRRGFSPCVVCEVCGHVWHCPNCDVSLTYHRRQESLRCHHCDHSMRLPENCPECGNHGVGPRGVGTEQLEGHLKGLFPNHVSARLDRDTSGGRRLQKVIQRFARREIDLLVGTQMVTKGHDFPGVTTVGVVQADLGLNFPDLRGAERTFQLLTQVAGRAGRGEDPGHVFVQTYSPDHYALQAARDHDYEAFADAELVRRQMFGYPPFGYLVAVKIEGERENAVAAVARDYLHAARRRLRHSPEAWGDTAVKGPAPAPFERLRGKTRWQLLFQGSDRAQLRRLVWSVLQDVGHFDPETKRAAHVVVDVDPINML